jgi:hypothetical protein
MENSLEFLLLAEQMRGLSLKFQSLFTIMEDLEPVLHVKSASLFNKLLSEDEVLKDIKRKIEDLSH